MTNAWVIQIHYADPDSTFYWNGNRGSDDYAWTEDVQKAIRFSREIDAERVFKGGLYCPSNNVIAVKKRFT